MKKNKMLIILWLLAVSLSGCGEKKPVPEDYWPQIVETDQTMPVQDCEFILNNGAFFGMDYDMVKELCGNDVYEFSYDGDDVGGFLCDGIFYGFYADAEGILRLRTLNIQDAQEYYGEYGIVKETLFRDIHLGDTLESVFAKIPAEDTALRQWEWQDVYGPNDDGSYAALEYVANSYYALQISTSGGYRAHMTFSRSARELLWIEIYDESPASELN